MIADRPHPPPELISVIVPVLDAEAYVGDQMEALSRQTYAGRWELVVADNGCRDRTIDVVRSWAPRLPELRVADATARRGLNHARNAGAQAARGDFLTFCDADDVVSPGWLEAMARAATDSDLVGGRLEFDKLNDPLVRAWRVKQPMTGLQSDHGFMTYAPGGNLGVWASVVHAVGWDERFRFGSSDHVFTWRAQLDGYTLAYADDAVIHQRFRTTLRALARQYYRYGKSGPHLHKAFRGDGIPPPDNAGALRYWRRVVKDIPRLHRSAELRGNWVRLAAFRIGRLVGSAEARVLCL
jgi:glycosyltransferase involved in cell wall biosynthesis